MILVIAAIIEDVVAKSQQTPANDALAKVKTGDSGALMTDQVTAEGKKKKYYVVKKKPKKIKMKIYKPKKKYKKIKVKVPVKKMKVKKVKGYLIKKHKKH